MNDADPPAPSAASSAAKAPAPAPNRAGAQRIAWVLFAPPALLVGLGWVLAWLQERSALAVLLPLTPFEPAQGLWAVLQPVLRVLLALVLVLAVALWVRQRVGTRRVLRALGVAWVALCLVVAAGMVRRDLNVRGAQPLPPVPAQVIGSRAKAPSTRGPGGTLLVLRVHALAQPQQVLVDDPQAARWQHGQRLLLAWSRGRYQGLFVTGWRPLSAPASAPGRPGQVQASAQPLVQGLAETPLQAVALSRTTAVPVFKAFALSAAFTEPASIQTQPASIIAP